MNAFRLEHGPAAGGTAGPSPWQGRGQLSPGRAWPLTAQGLFGAFRCVGFLDFPGRVLMPRLHF